jgi:hypothetical protein
MTLTTKHKIGNKVINVKRKPKRVEFMAGIEFGMLSKGCKNFGICRIQIINREELLSLNKKFENFEAMALIYIEPDGKVEMFFLYKGMEEKIKKLYFGRKHFIVGEDVMINTPVICKNQHPPKGIIKKGAYPFTKRPWGYWVRFN